MAITIVNEAADPVAPVYSPKFEFGASGQKDTYIEAVNYLKRASWWQKIFYRFKKAKTILVNMELQNGYHTSFIAFVKENGFKFRGKKYVIDPSLYYEHLPTGLFGLDYHEDFALPIKRKFDVNAIQNALKESKITDIELATNPSVLEQFINSKIQDMILRGGQLDAFMRQIRLFVVITGLVCIAHLFLFMYKTGMFQNVKF